MSTTNKAVKTLVASAVLATMATAVTTQAHALGKGKEKCYGVVKAGQNGCGDAEGKHSCQGYAPEDGQWSEWIALPKGVCDKIVGGSTKPMNPVDAEKKEEMAK